MWIAEGLGGLLFLGALVAVGHELFLASVAILRPPKSRLSEERAASTRFLILIPAHDEEKTVGGAIRSCLSIDYPRSLFEICVIADNCTDATAEVVRSFHVDCLERHDPQHRGKGAALNWALQRVGVSQDPDAYVILDADCEIDPHALRAFEQRLAAGQEVLQTRYVCSNPDRSAISYALALGNYLEDHFYYQAKSRLGGTVLLRGTGMVFRRSILRGASWNPDSLVEDQSLSVELLERGVTIHHVPHVAVRSAFPHTLDQLRIQRGRWARGNAALGRSRGIRLIGTGLLSFDGRALDLGLTILLQSRALHLVLLGGLGAYAITCLLVTGSQYFEALLGAAVVLGIAYLGYIVLGILKLGLSRRRLLFLMELPIVALRVVRIGIGQMASSSSNWSRTPRT